MRTVTRQPRRPDGVVGPTRSLLFATLFLVSASLPAHAATRASSMSGGYWHTCAVTRGGAARCWGENVSGQLGDGTTTNRAVPVEVSGLTSGVASVAAGGSHSCALTTAGGVKCWGKNTSGELGDGTNLHRLAPVPVQGLASGVAAIAAGSAFTCALTTGGGVKCWGANWYGELGDGTRTERWTPTNVAGLTSGVIAIAAGLLHACAVTSGGAVTCWGRNSAGQLGDGTRDERLTPVPVVGLGAGIVTVAAGVEHTCAVTTGGTAKCWGSNSSGQLGDYTPNYRTTPGDVLGLSGAQSVALGSDHTCAIVAGGHVKCWGGNYSGQLGDGTTHSRVTPTDDTPVPAIVVALSAGESRSCALTSGGSAWCWGSAHDGQLGNGSEENRDSPVMVEGLGFSVAAIDGGSAHTCAVTAAGSARCWGWNAYGQLGDGTTTIRTVPTQVAGLSSGAAAVSAGSGYTCAVTIAGGAKCWGTNGDGQLGDGTRTQRTTPVDVVGLASGIVAIATSTAHTCALTTAGGVKCWGRNTSGQLGDGTRTDRPAPVDVSGLTHGVAAVVVGWDHACALTTSGGVKCWGSNLYGQLGTPPTTTTGSPTPVDVPGLTSGVVGIDTDGRSSYALTTGGGVKGWGGEAGSEGPIMPLTDIPGLASGVAAIAMPCVVTTAGGVRCLADYWWMTNPRLVDVPWLTSGVASVTAGGHQCARTLAGSALCWGNNSHGQLGDPASAPHSTPTRVFVFDRAEPSDFDGDAKSDATVFRPSNGTWYQQRSTGAGGYGVSWGLAGDLPVPGDYDGDGVSDPAVFRPSTGTWYVLQSTTATGVSLQWGLPDDTPVPADYDGDGKIDAAVYRPSTGTWFIVRSATHAAIAISWGITGDVPVPADYDGDGKADPTVFRASDGTWYQMRSLTGMGAGVKWGQAGDVPVAGDYDGDTKADPTVFRASTGTWYELRSTTGVGFGVTWGTEGDVPIVGDYDGDGKADPTVFRPSTNTWYELRSTTGVGHGVVWGATGDKPL